MNGKMTKARKDHKCTLCEKKIATGEHYWYENITPWDHPDNEGYSTFKAHERCHSAWLAIGGKDYDWEFPRESDRWAEDMEEYYESEQTKKKCLQCENYKKCYGECANRQYCPYHGNCSRCRCIKIKT